MNKDMDVKKMTKKQLVAETIRLLEEQNYCRIRQARVEVSIYKGCEKIGNSRYVFTEGGLLYCVMILADGGLAVKTDSQLNSGNIYRIYEKLKKDE